MPATSRLAPGIPAIHGRRRRQAWAAPVPPFQPAPRLLPLWPPPRPPLRACAARVLPLRSVHAEIVPSCSTVPLLGFPLELAAGRPQQLQLALMQRRNRPPLRLQMLVLGPERACSREIEARSPCSLASDCASNAARVLISGTTAVNNIAPHRRHRISGVGHHRRRRIALELLQPGQQIAQRPVAAPARGSARSPPRPVWRGVLLPP